MTAIKLAALCLVFFLSACGTRQPVVYKTESYFLPAIGSTSTKGVGESMIKKYTGVLVPDYIDIHEDVLLDKYRLPADRYAYQDDNAYGEWFRNKDRSVYFFAKKSDGMLCDATAKTETCSRAKYTIQKKISDVVQNSFQQTLIYNGKIGNRITIGYREFSNNLAREAFSNNVDYDLNESPVIGYKGARFEIIKATNTEITYRVIAGFSD
jgi:hypothetical protein